MADPDIKELRKSVALGLGFLLVFALALLIVAAFFAGESSASSELKLVALIAAGAAILVVSLAGLASLLIMLGFGDAGQALGMPVGSVRAFIAILLIALFAVVAVWLYGEIDEAKAAQQRFAFQVLTTVSTLVVAAAAFYFGTRSVRTATEAVGGVPRPVIDSVSPTAVTVSTAIDPTNFVASGARLRAPATISFVQSDDSSVILPCAVNSWSVDKIRFSVAKADLTGLAIPTGMSESFDLVIVFEDQEEAAYEGALTVTG